MQHYPPARAKRPHSPFDKMANIPVENATVEDLKHNEKVGITTSDFYVYVKVPGTYVHKPSENQGLATTSVNNEILRSLILTCSKAYVHKLYKKTLVLCFVVSNKYLSIFHRKLRNLESAVLIKGEQHE